MKFFENNNDTKIFALGGLGEVGKNMYCIMQDNEIIIIDAGVIFPEEELRGIDYVLPDWNFLKKNEKKIKGTFLKTALTNALPFALVIMLNIVFLTVMGTRFGIEYSSLKTMMYLLIGFVSILAVQEVCTPFNKIHAFLFSTTAVGFYTAVLLFHNILKVDLIDNKALIITGILAIISYVLISIKRVIYKKIFN